MKICFFSPYMPEHFGGGEKHLLDVASVAAQEHEVSLAIAGEHSSDDLKSIKKEYARFSGHSLQQVVCISTPLGTSTSALKKLWWTKNFDAMYYVTDGSLFFTLCRHRYLHIQIPFTNKVTTSLAQRKLAHWHNKNANSFFTKRIVEQSWKTTVDSVLYPMVDTALLHTVDEKEPIILSVGRFFRTLHSKRQDVLVSIFRQLLLEHPKQMANWKLYLVGGAEDETYVQYVKKLAEGLPVIFAHTLSRVELVDLYKKASLYWHAAGFEIDQVREPAKVEHFGITTVEAMAAGAVPLVVGKGGQAEILEGFSELQWESERECVEKTHRLIAQPKELSQLRTKITVRAAEFDLRHFSDRVLHLFRK